MQKNSCDCDNCTLKPVDTGKDAPNVVNVIIEMQRGTRNKFEADKESGMLVLDRVNATRLSTPCDYGYIPHTLCEDGDPLDVMIVMDETPPYGSVVPARPIGVLFFKDEGEMDEKIIAVPAIDVSKDHIKNVDDLGENFKKVVVHYYSHYKDWKNDWKGSEAEFTGWGDAEESKKVVAECVERYKSGQ